MNLRVFQEIVHRPRLLRRQFAEGDRGHLLEHCINSVFDQVVDPVQQQLKVTQGSIDVNDILIDVDRCPRQSGQSRVDGPVELLKVKDHQLVEGLRDLGANTDVLLQHELLQNITDAAQNLLI